MADNITLIILWFFLALIIIISVWFVMNTITEKAFGATNATPAAVTPTPVATPVETAPNPNFQYLPQKAYVQPYAPELGLPSNSQPLTAVPQVVPVAPVQAQQQGVGGLDLTSIIAAITGIAGVGYAHISKKKADAATDLTKTTMAGTLSSKEQIEQLARTLFNSMPNKGNEVTGAEAIKLENLSKDKQDFADTAAKA